MLLIHDGLQEARERVEHPSNLAENKAYMGACDEG